VYKPGFSLFNQGCSEPTSALAAESRVSSVRSDRNHKTRAHWDVGRELLGRIAPCRKQPRIDRSMRKRELCSLRNKKNEKGSRNLRKSEGENISLYATLQEPEFRCFTLNSKG